MPYSIIKTTQVSEEVEEFLGSETPRPDFVPKWGYISPEFVQLENERLWPKVWQVACREEEVKAVGDFVTYEIAGESIVVIRASETQLKAYYNVCPHRGRRLMEKHGNSPGFYCRFHGWSWDLEGNNTFVQDPDDWHDCPNMDKDSLSLKTVQLDTWGGFVFINMDPDCVPLDEFLQPVQQYFAPFEPEKWRYKWYYSIKVPCNWKVGMEAFNEGYHVYTTHPQVRMLNDDLTRSYVDGDHAHFDYSPSRPGGSPSVRTGEPMPDDFREPIINTYNVLSQQLDAVWTERDREAVTRLRTELAEGASPEEAWFKAYEVIKSAWEASGAGFPPATLEDLARVGMDWQIFPNLLILPSFCGALVYRIRPDGDNPDQSIFEVYSMQRYAEGMEPELKRKYLWGENEYLRFGEEVSIIQYQDFLNMAEVQQGMKSRGFTGSRTNPMQESAVYNLHRVIYRYLFESGEDAAGATP